MSDQFNHEDEQAADDHPTAQQPPLNNGPMPNDVRPPGNYGQPNGAAQQPPYGQAPYQPYDPRYTPNYGQQPYPLYPPYSAQQASDILLMEYPGGEKRLVKLASRGARFGAYIIDSLLSSIPSGILAVIFFVRFLPQLISYARLAEAGGNLDPYNGMPIEFSSAFISEIIFWLVAITVLSLVVQIVYYGLIPVWTKGQTLGKKMLGMRAVHENGHYLSTGGQLLRGLVGFSLLSLFTSGITVWVSAVMILVTDKRQGIHDFIAASLVISEKPF